MKIKSATADMYAMADMAIKLTMQEVDYVLEQIEKAKLEKLVDIIYCVKNYPSFGFHNDGMENTWQEYLHDADVCLETVKESVSLLLQKARR